MSENCKCSQSAPDLSSTTEIHMETLECVSAAWMTSYEARGYECSGLEAESFEQGALWAKEDIRRRLIALRRASHLRTESGRTKSVKGEHGVDG